MSARAWVCVHVLYARGCVCACVYARGCGVHMCTRVWMWWMRSPVGVCERSGLLRYEAYNNLFTIINCHYYNHHHHYEEALNNILLLLTVTIITTIIIIITTVISSACCCSCSSTVPWNREHLRVQLFHLHTHTHTHTHSVPQPFRQLYADFRGRMNEYLSLQEHTL